MAKKKLFSQLYLPLLVLMAAVLVALAGFSISSIRNFYYNQINNELSRSAKILKEPVKNFLSENRYSELDAYCKRQGKLTGLRITVVLPEGTVVAESERDPREMASHKDRVEIVEALKVGESTSTRQSGTQNAETMYVAIRVDYNDGDSAVLRTSLTLLTISNIFENILTKISLGAITAIVTMALLSIVILNKFTKPLAEICLVARSFANGNLTSRAPQSEIDELNDLSAGLNDMASQLDSRIKTIIQQRNETETIFNNMSEGLLAINNERKLININQAAADIFDIDVEHVLKNDIAIVIRKTELIEFVEHTFNSGEGTETEITIPGKSDRHLLLRGAAYDIKGDEAGVIIVISDITRLKILENIRKEFVANVSHELKTPITAIRGFVETLQDGAIDDKEQAEKFLDIISRQTERMHALIEDLLSLSRLEHSVTSDEISFDGVFISELFEDILDTFETRANDKNIQISINCNEHLKIHGNKALLVQALGNLVDNALKYSPESGNIDIFAVQEGPDVYISVKDEGCGIPADHHERLFERFYVVDKSRSRKLGGTGLGLAIVKHIARIHKGNVSVQSSPGNGSIFTITLPV